MDQKSLLEVEKKPPTSDADAEAVTFLHFWDTMWSGLFGGDDVIGIFWIKPTLINAT